MSCASMQQSLHKTTKLQPSEFQIGPNEAVFSTPFDKAWDAMLDIVSNFPIITINKESGIIITDWKTETAPFIFIVGKSQYDSGIFRSEAGGSFSQKRTRLNIRLKEETERTKISISTSVEVYFDNTVVAIVLRSSNYIKEWRPCLSDGIAESKILDAIRNKLAVASTDRITSFSGNKKSGLQDNQRVSVSEQQNSSQQIVHEEAILINILSTHQGNYLLIYLESNAPMKISEKYDIVRLNAGLSREKPIKVGEAKVIQLGEKKAALLYNLAIEDALSISTDKILYK